MFAHSYKYIFFSIYIDMENIRIRIKISTLEICNVPQKKNKLNMSNKNVAMKKSFRIDIRSIT